MHTTELSVGEARRLLIGTQRFATRRRTATMDELIETIERLGCVQIDTIATVDRSHRLVLASRCGKVPELAHDRLLRSGRVFEYWAHEACLLPMRDYPHYRHAMQNGRLHRWHQGILGEHPKLADEVVATARERGEISARDFGGAGSGYWEWTPAKRVLEALWTAGVLAIAGRKGVERRYALAEDVVPDDVLGAPAPPLDETRCMQVVRAVHARGIASEGRIADYFRVDGRSRTLRPAIDRLVVEGVLTRVQVAGISCLVAVDALPEIARFKPTGAHLVSPFDNVLWDRVEAERLLDFSHRLEIYKRPHERIFGYYVLPLIDGAEIIGRVDTKADRKAGELRAVQVHWERRARPRALAQALERLAFTLGLKPVLSAAGQ